MLRENLLGENLRYVEVNPEDITEFPNGIWFEYDFNDLIVDVGETYYIVCYTANNTDNMYIWGGNVESSYENGEAFYSLDDGQTWNTNPFSYVVDMCFMTFGRDNKRPYSPIIDGPNGGTVGVFYDYEFTADDPDGDNMTYYVDWGDGSIDEGFVESEGGFTLTHSWGNNQDFTIKAKLIDDYGAESNWATFDVSIPRIKTIHNSFIYRFTNLLPILRLLLQRLV
jgi:hypothetical protein